MRRLLLRGAVFDMDGVLVDSHPAHRLAWKQFLRDMGKDVPDSELDFIMDGRKREDILVHFLGLLTEAQSQEYGRQKSELFSRIASEIVPIAGVEDFIEHLDREDIPMAIATSATSNRALFTLKRQGWLNRFRAVVTGDDVPQGKPHPAIYQLACERLHCLPENTLAFEDAPSGVRAAKSAGLHCVGIAGTQSEAPLSAAGADTVVRNFVGLTLRNFDSFFAFSTPPDTPPPM